MLGGLPPHERQQLYKRAMRLRKMAQSNGRSRAASEGDGRRKGSHDDGPTFERIRRSGGSLDDWVLRVLKEELDGPAPTGARYTAAARGRVVSLTAGECCVATGDGEMNCALPAEITALQQTGIAVGDEVQIAEDPHAGRVVCAVLPRRTTLSRPDPKYGHIERVVAANMEVVVIVVSVSTPPLHPKLIDRFLVAIQRGGAEPVLCANKVDELPEDATRSQVLAKLEPYRQLGLHVLLCSAATGEGVEHLRRALCGRLCVFVGHSGVGKSSLLNALDPDLGLATKAVGEKHGRGRHTTSASHLYELPGPIEVIDTPGVREFGLWKMTAQDVGWYFAEIRDLAPQCRYSDCSHSHEPGCAVKRAVRQGRVAAPRYDSYRRLLASL